MQYTEVLLKPILTEKSTTMSENAKYVFKVATASNKRLIKQAVKSLFNVEATDVNIVNVRPRMRRNRYKIGFKPAYKKAIVTLKKGDKIDLFESK